MLRLASSTLFAHFCIFRNHYLQQLDGLSKVQITQDKFADPLHTVGVDDETSRLADYFPHLPDSQVSGVLAYRLKEYYGIHTHTHTRI
jgi:hypothetical protein